MNILLIVVGLYLLGHPVAAGWTAVISGFLLLIVSLILETQ
jgi:hypothetical protein